mgnify:CR=1 FL=1
MEHMTAIELNAVVKTFGHVRALDGLAGSYLWSEESLAVRTLDAPVAYGQLPSAGTRIRK